MTIRSFIRDHPASILPRRPDSEISDACRYISSCHETCRPKLDARSNASNSRKVTKYAEIGAYLSLLSNSSVCPAAHKSEISCLVSGF